MFCTYCGRSIEADQRFCGSCGNTAIDAMPNPTAPPYLPQPAGRVTSHVRIVGICWIAFSAIYLVRGGGRLLGARLVRVIGHSWSDESPLAWPAAHILHSLLWTVGLVSVVLAVAGFVVGFGLLEHRAWARSLAIVLAVIALLSPILGTALGIYTLWVLLPEQAGQEWRQTARTV